MHPQYFLAISDDAIILLSIQQPFRRWHLHLPENKEDIVVACFETATNLGFRKL